MNGTVKNEREKPVVNEHFAVFDGRWQFILLIHLQPTGSLYLGKIMY